MELVQITHSLDQASFPPLETLRDRYGWSPRTHRIFDRMFGLESTALHPDLTLLEGLHLSAERLASRNPELCGQVDVLVYCHALNMSLPFAESALAQLGEQVFDCAPEVLSVTQGSCAGAIMAIQALAARDREGPQNIVLLTGEKCFFELLDYADNNGLFGEVTSAVHLRLGDGSGGSQVLATTAGVFPGVCKPLAGADKDLVAAYDQAFIPTMSRAVETVLANADLKPDDIDVVLPTHLSPFTFNRVATQVGIPSDRVVKQNLARIGHCFCGDLFINLDTLALSDDAPAHPINILSFAAGMTGSYAAIVLRKEPTS